MKNFKALKLTGNELTIEYPVYKTEVITLPSAMTGIELVAYVDSVLDTTPVNEPLPDSEIDFELENTLNIDNLGNPFF